MLQHRCPACTSYFTICPCSTCLVLAMVTNIAQCPQRCQQGCAYLQNRVFPEESLDWCVSANTAYCDRRTILAMASLVAEHICYPNLSTIIGSWLPNYMLWFQCLQYPRRHHISFVGFVSLPPFKSAWQRRLGSYAKQAAFPNPHSHPF